MERGKMFEGKVIKVVHPSGEIKNGIIAGCDEKKGITVISADKPDDILFCNSLQTPFDREMFGWFVEAVQEGKEWDFVEELAKRKGLSEIQEAFLRMSSMDKGALQEELHERCPFK